MSLRFIKVLVFPVLALVSLSVVVFAGPLSEDIFQAAVDGDKEAIEDLIDKGADVNKTNAEQKTVLMLAAQYKHPDLIEYLLNQTGAKQTLNNRDKRGWTAVMYGADSGDLATVQAIVENAGGELNLNLTEFKTEKTALDLTAIDYVADYLRSNGAKTSEELRRPQRVQLRRRDDPPTPQRIQLQRNDPPAPTPKRIQLRRNDSGVKKQIQYQLNHK